MIQYFKEQYHYIIRLLCDKRLNEAIVELKEFLVKTNDWNLLSKLEQTETSYTYMLEYMRRSVIDPERKELQFKLIRDTLSVADQGMIIHQSIDQTHKSYAKAKKSLEDAHITYTLDSILIELESYTENYAVTNLLQTENRTEKLNEVRKRHEEIQSYLFALVWTNPLWTVEDDEVARRWLSSVLIPENDLCLFVSAVTLSILACFDKRKLMFLFDTYQHENNMINQRALVGLTIIFQIYHDRLPFYPEVTSRLSLLNENDKFANDLNRVQIQMLMSRETEKINKKMREEIIPEMIKNANAHNMRINPDEHDEDMDDFNPDWAQDFENSALGKKLQEMSELQMEGADVYMGTFAGYKNYPFFSRINNWFYPFDKQHSTLADDLSKGTGSNVLDLILESAFFCDSDKYSLYFTIRQIPQAHREMMIKQLSEQQIDELLNEEKSTSIKKFTNKPEIISNQYIQNLYRFFKLYSYRADFQDIFKEPLRMNEYPVLRDIMYKTYLFKQLVDFYFRKEHYTEAAEIYHILIKLESDNAEIYQKLGYCYQKQKNFDLALDAYLKADMIKPDNVWTNRHLATCYRVMKDYGKAIYYYKKVEEVQPENRSLLFNMGSCLVELERYDEALHYFFKLDFLDTDSLRAWRAIAWCSFILQKLEQSMKYYDKILEKNGVAPDYLNAGHVAWGLGNMSKAIELYTKSCQLSGSKTLFLDVFNKDKEYLIQAGISEYDIALMYDLL